MVKSPDERGKIAQQLSEIELKIKELRIRYEQYFAGVEKRAPLKEREALERLLRRLNQRKIIQTDLRYRYQNLASSFYSYQGMWDRIQREMDEGRYHRQQQKESPASSRQESDISQLFDEYTSVCRQCHRAVPQREQLEAFIQQQRENIRKKYGNVTCSFHVINDNGKPKITANLKR